MKTIYRSKEGKEKIINLYDSQLTRLKTPWKDAYVDTTFGKTHIIETGNLLGEPLLVFHGGNATTAYNLLACDFIMKDFHIYAVDMVGHPGKSAETSLTAKGYDYGQWVSEVIDGLKYDKISLFIRYQRRVCLISYPDMACDRTSSLSHSYRFGRMNRTALGHGCCCDYP